MCYKYETESWQGFIQQIVYLVSRGYQNYCLISYPERKRGKWNSIDEKLIEKYKLEGMSKFQRARLKLKGIANFSFLRWNNLAVILHTSGNIPLTVQKDDIFNEISIRPIKIQISEMVELLIYIESIQGQKGKDKTANNEKARSCVTVKMSSDMYRGIKLALTEAAKTQRKLLLLNEYNKLNGIPAYKGIIVQKRALAAFASKAGRKNQIKITANEFRISTRRPVCKVFQNEINEADKPQRPA